MADTKRLGENQKHILKGLADGRLNGTGWVWQNRSTTLRLMKGLVRRGLVSEQVTELSGDRKSYSWNLTEAGQKWVELERTPTLPETDRNTLILMMAEQNLEWSPDAGWHLKNQGYTLLGMRDLEKQGLVRQVGDKAERRYAAGSALLDKAYALGFDPSLLDDEQN